MEIVAVAKAAKEKVVKAAATATTAAAVTMSAAMDHVPAEGMAGTAAPGVASAAPDPGTMVDVVMADGALAPMAYPLRIQEAVIMIVLSHR